MIPAHRSLLALVALAAACSAPGRESFGVLRPGRFVEAKGNFVGGTAQVREIDEAPREPDDRGDKAEVTAPVERAESGGLVVLGNVFALADDTKFEETIGEALGRRPERPAALQGIEDLPQRVEVIDVSVDAVKAIIQRLLD